MADEPLIWYQGDNESPWGVTLKDASGNPDTSIDGGGCVWTLTDQVYSKTKFEYVGEVDDQVAHPGGALYRQVGTELGTLLETHVFTLTIEIGFEDGGTQTYAIEAPFIAHPKRNTLAPALSLPTQPTDLVVVAL